MIPNSTFKHYLVPSGSYYVSRQEALILEAYLGTCVGVALYDEESGIGGLSHLLLPEPLSLAGSVLPEKYASTGFPMFLRALYDQGASKKNIKAVLAGGALVDPIESVDLLQVFVQRSVANHAQRPATSQRTSDCGEFVESR